MLFGQRSRATACAPSRTVGGASAGGVKRLDFLEAVLEDAEQAVLGEVAQGV